MSWKNGQPCGDDECEKLRASEHFDEDTQNTSQKCSNTTLSLDEPNVSANWALSESWLEQQERSCITSYQEFDNTLDQVEYIFKYNHNKLTIAASEHFKEDTQNKSLKLISTHLEPDITTKHNYITSPEVTSKAVSNTTLPPYDKPNLFANGDVTNSFLNLEKMADESCDMSSQEFDNTLEEIESTHLEPDITTKHNYISSPEVTSKAVSNTTLSPNDEPNLFANGDVTNNFLNLEKMADESCDMSSQEFDNTLEEIEYILKNAPKLAKQCKANQLDTETGISQQNVRQTIAASENFEEDTQYTSQKLISTHLEPDITSKHNYMTSPEIISKAVSNTTLSPDDPNLFANGDVSNSFFDFSCDTSSEELDNTLEETKKLDTEMGKMSVEGNSGNLALNLKPAIVTTMKKEQKEKEIFGTSSSVLQTKPSSYKTQLNPPVFQKPSTSSLKKTPSKNPAFQHVASPVAYYINSSPRIPLMRNVHLKETSPGLPSIPELVKTTALKPNNKEYINLPNVAYKSAKETKVIDVSNAPRMPQSQWAKKLTRSNPRPAVIKHTHREEFINKHSETTNREPEDSFGDLSLHQADISVCTKKAAL